MTYDPERHCGHPKTGGANKGEPCALPKGWGTPHVGYGCCKKHRGNTPTHIKAGQKAMARDAVATYGLPRDVDPHAALLEEVHRTAGHVQWLGEVVADIEKGELVWGMVEKTEGLERGEATDIERMAVEPNVWLKLYQDERKHLVDVCRVAISCGIAERRVQLAEQEARMLADAMLNFARAAGLDTGDPDVRSLMREQLLLVAEATEDVIDV